MAVLREQRRVDCGNNEYCTENMRGKHALTQLWNCSLAVNEYVVQTLVLIQSYTLFCHCHQISSCSPFNSSTTIPRYFAIRTRRYGTESGGSFFKTFLKLFYTHMFNFTPPIAYLRGFILYVVAVVFQQ
ncbi:unnamed protein product [Adineta ricciae]|uniref:Uncharacterized protein n=1 Tax=Adineta ricciae TaxID=249248 RepID=A0A815LS70_ADIRI|nr:unnamed protein product [Adineta ricciae]